MEDINFEFVKRSQKDYSMSFKLSVVHEVQSGSLSQEQARRKYGIQGSDTVRRWLQKYGILDVCYSSTSKLMKTPQQKIQELEQQVRLLERQNQFLAEQLVEKEDKAAILDKLIDLAEQEYIIPIRKNFSPDQSRELAKKNKKR